MTVHVVIAPDCFTGTLTAQQAAQAMAQGWSSSAPHDLLTLGLFNDDLTEITMHARTGVGSDLGGTFPQPYPPAIVRDWDFDIVDDRENHPLERDRAPT